jgi:hypothetical protein
MDIEFYSSISMYPAIRNGRFILFCAAFGSFIILASAMKLTGFLLLLTGWGITLSAIVLLPQAGVRGAFMLAGMTVEVLGLVLATRAHLPQREVRE